MIAFLCKVFILSTLVTAIKSSGSDGILESTCLIYRTSNVCNLCVKGYYPDANGICRLITIPNCDRVNKDGQCMLCGNGVLVKDGKCDTTTRCSDTNCSLCAFNMERQEKCVSCNLSHILLIDESLKYGECVSRTDEDDPHCISKAELSHIGLTCYACETGYTLSSNKCTYNATFQLNELSANSGLIWRLASTAFLWLIFLF